MAPAKQRFYYKGDRLKPLRAFCRCSPDGVVGMLRSFPQEDRADMVEPDGSIHVTCEYCSRKYEIPPDTI